MTQSFETTNSSLPCPLDNNNLQDQEISQVASKTSDCQFAQNSQVQSQSLQKSLTELSHLTDLQQNSQDVVNSNQATHPATPVQSSSTSVPEETANQIENAGNQVYSNLYQNFPSNYSNETLTASLDCLNSYDFYYNPSFYFTSPVDPLLPYQQSLYEQYQQLQQSYYSFPSQFASYQDAQQLQSQQFNYPFSSSQTNHSLEFGPCLNFDPSQQPQLQSYYPSSCPTDTFQPESFSNHNSSSPFFFDEVPLSRDIVQGSQLSEHLVIPDYQYVTLSREVIGTGSYDKGLHPLSIRRCFNCGDPNHSLTACPDPRNEPLIRLTKQMFQAHNQNEDDQADNLTQQNDSGSKLKESLNENLKDSINQRKLLAKAFTPGQVSNSLREALFWERDRGEPDENYLDPSRPMPWFQLMEKWGYPPSYAIDPNTKRNPFQAVLERIDDLEKDRAWDSVEILQMYEERPPDDLEDEEDIEEDEEEILKMLVPGYEARRTQAVPLPPENPSKFENLSFPDHNSLPPLPNTPPKDIPLKRLVLYKGGNFSSDILPIYNGQPISARSYLDQYSTNSTTNHHHYPNARSDHHYSQKSPRRSLSPSLSKAKRSPYSSFHHSRATSSTRTNPVKNFRAKKQDEAVGKVYTRRWKDAALTFAAAHQKVQPPTIVHSHNPGNGHGARNRFYIDPDAPPSYQERSTVINQELNYSDDSIRDDLINSSAPTGRQNDIYKDDPLVKKRRGSRSNNVNNSNPGFSSRQRHRNKNLNRAQVNYYEDRNGMENRKKIHKREEDGTGEIPSNIMSNDNVRMMTSMVETFNKRKITNVYQEEKSEDLVDSKKEKIHENNDNDAKICAKGQNQDNSYSCVGGQVNLNHFNIPPPPLPLSPPPDDPDPPTCDLPPPPS